MKLPIIINKNLNLKAKIKTFLEKITQNLNKKNNNRAIRS